MTPSEPQRKPVWCVEHHELSWLYSDGSLGCWYCLTVETGCHCTPGEPIITRREAQGIPPSEALRVALERLLTNAADHTNYEGCLEGAPWPGDEIPDDVECPACQSWIRARAALAATPSGGIPLIDVDLLAKALSALDLPAARLTASAIADEYARLASESSHFVGDDCTEDDIAHFAALESSPAEEGADPPK